MTLLTLSSQRRVAWPAWLPLAAVAVVAAALRQIVMANADVSWDLTLADKWLDGARLYVDIIEVNPPATVFLYVPPAALARLIGIRAEVAVDILVFIAIGLSMSLTIASLRRADLLAREQVWPVTTIMLAALAILPAQTFGEREQIALVTFLPLVAAHWLRAARTAPSWPMVIAAGLGAGLTAIIKPYFVVAIIGSAAVAAWSARSWRVLFAIEHWIAAAALAAYAALVWLAFPAFIADMLPLLSAVYVPIKLPLVAFLVHGALPLVVIALVVLRRVAGRDVLTSPIALLLAASAGFGVAYVVQRKGWPYHAYPMLALVFIALGYALLTPRRDRLIGVIGGLAIAGAAFFWMQTGVNRVALAPAIKAIAPHARVLALSDDLSVGHPATRQAGGVWVGRLPSLWITAGVVQRLDAENLDAAAQAALMAYADRDRAMLVEDIARNRPDVILVHVGTEAPGWLDWARADPALAAELKAYRPDRTLGDVLILRRAKP